MMHGHGGSRHEAAIRLGCAVETLTDLSGNLNPAGPPAGLLRHLSGNMGSVVMLPDSDTTRVASSIGNLFDINTDSILVGNGTTQFIHTLPLVLGIRRALVVTPTYADYRDACRLHGAKVDDFPLSIQSGCLLDLDLLSAESKKYDTVFLCNPNNPTGGLLDAEEIRRLCRSAPKTRFVVDETYMPFVSDYKKKRVLADLLPNLVVLVSLSKIFTLPGLRIGFFVATGEILRSMQSYAMPWTVNAVAQEAIFYLDQNLPLTRKFMEDTRSQVAAEHLFMEGRLAGMSKMKLWPATTIFRLVELTNELRAEDICSFLEKDRILIRNCANIKGLSNRFIRFSLGTREENETLVTRLMKCCR